MAADDLAFDPRQLGAHLARARAAAGLSQGALAARCQTTQQQVSAIESGTRGAALGQILQMARVLDLPIQRLLTGEDRPGARLEEIAIELRRLGIVDLWVRDAKVPGAFRPAEEVVNLAIVGGSPDPRIVEAIPAVLAWAELDHLLLTAYAARSGTTRRLAWLADLTLSIDRRVGFPGGCRRQPLEQLLEGITTPGRDQNPDDLGKPAEVPPTSPLWRRWKIGYASDLERFLERARALHSLRTQQRDRSIGRTRMIVPVGRTGETPSEERKPTHET